MRRALIAVATGALLAGLSGFASPAQADLIVDYTVEVTSNPATVSPGGEWVEYRVEISNPGPVDATGTLTNTTDNGVFKETADCVEDVSSADPNEFTCAVAIPAASSIFVDVLVETPTLVEGDAPVTVTNTSSFVSDPNALNDVVDVNQDNNTNQSASTTVLPPNGDGSSAFLKPGEQLEFKKHVLKVIKVGADNESGGVQANMKNSAATVAAHACGDSLCDPEGLNVSFGDGEAGERSYGLVEIDLLFSEQDPCHGLGASKCFERYYLSDAEGATPQLIDDPCPSSGEPTPGSGPCFVRTYKVDNLIRVVVRQWTNDPDYLQPIKDLTEVTG